ncbi:acyl-CoA thioesterase [Sphingomonas sp. IC-11]|uniref:acyl-CoA thioesterase n=1 Tax=Sphingomonas sp. IC-11 TaxID=2898528 RepID=UPI001E2B2625|nr:acyl-CoA thioesterase [Sphingomonas sp. IC-11]MCD2316303.1 acyl-CoA thioesterase [Sphingomonas sp. IC-11]
MSFSKIFTAAAEDIDELGHVNNAVWVRWIQDLAVAHWEAVAPDEHRHAFVWVVTRHEIDYRGNLAEGASATGKTWVPEPPRGARFNRHFCFADSAGRTLVEGITTWAMLDRASGRLVRVRPDIAAPFLVG